MDWDKRTISPNQPNSKKQNCAPSPPLMRFFASIGFITIGLGTLYSGLYLFGINPEILQAPNWNIETVIVLVISLICAAFGGLIGAGIGLSINIKSERVNHVLNTFWHYYANGVLIWFFLLMLCLEKLYSEKGLAQFVNETGTWHFTIITIGIGASGSLLIGGILLSLGLLEKDSKPKVFRCIVLSLPIALIMGYYLFRFLAIDSRLWIFIGIMLPVVLIPVSAYMMNRDKIDRNQLLER